MVEKLTVSFFGRLLQFFLGNFQQNYFLDLLIRLEDEKKMSHEEVVKEVQFMFAASHETTAVTVSAVLLALGMHPDIQVGIIKIKYST
jgi:cytochrome P450